MYSIPLEPCNTIYNITSYFCLDFQIKVSSSNFCSVSLAFLQKRQSTASYRLARLRRDRRLQTSPVDFLGRVIHSPTLRLYLRYLRYSLVFSTCPLTAPFSYCFQNFQMATLYFSYILNHFKRKASKCILTGLKNNCRRKLI